MSGFARYGIQQARKDPFVDLLCSLCRQVHKTDATLPGRVRPTDLPVGFHAQTGQSQLEAHPNPLLLPQRSDCLHSYTFTVEIADDATVGGIECYIGQRTYFMAIVGACLP